MLALILRRMGMNLRIEVINSSPTGVPIIARMEPYAQAAAGPGAAPPVEATARQEGAEAPESRLDETEHALAERFDLGPSYEEEKQAKEESLRQREQAVLRELFEQNQRLYDEIEQLDAAGEGESHAAESDEQGREE
jgi:hypothetical protein